MKPVFYQYELKNNVLEELIQEFGKRQWKFSENGTDYFHKFKWPNIVLSDKEAKLNLPIDKDLNDNNEYTIELFGAYITGENSQTEGQVILYLPKICSTALDYARFKTKKSEFTEEERKYFIELLSTLVLIHEFTHWIIHVGTFQLSEDVCSKPIPLKYNDVDSIFFHETIAQIFTNYFCHKQPELGELFDWLEEKQPIQYQMYKDMIWGSGVAQLTKDQDTVCPKEGKFHQKIDEEWLSPLIFSVMVLRVSKQAKQSYEALKNIFKQVHEYDRLMICLDPHCIECFYLWDWNTEDIKSFVSESSTVDCFKDKKNQIVAKKFGI
jgi:hypothetical protein